MAEPVVAGTAPTADVVFVGGSVYTVNARDEVVEALAVAGERILRVGDRGYVEQTIGRTTRVVDLAGRALLPGFVDNHIHLSNAPQRTWVDCTYAVAPSIDDLADRIAERAREVPPGEWVLGRGFQADRLREGRNPNRFDLDRAAPDHPVGIANREGMGWTFNTRGLRRIGVEDHTPDPPGGPLERDAAGRPLGPMWDNARAVFIRPNLPAWTLEDLIDGYAWLAGELNRHGVTTAFEAAIRSPLETAAWRHLARRGRRTLRVVLGPYRMDSDRWEPGGAAGSLVASGLATGFGDAWLKLGALQLGIDGGVIGQTAALEAPYSNDPTGTRRGNFRISEGLANEVLAQAQARDWQVGLICHGDRGIARALDAIEYGRRAAPSVDLRHRLEHAYLWSPGTLDRMAEVGAIWNTQPAILEVLGRHAVEAQWGERARYAFPFRSLVRRGVVVSGGSDWGVGPYNPLVGLDVLVNHRFGPEEGGVVLNPDEGLTVLEALRVYTYNGAVTAFEEHEKGSLEAGKLADLAVLSADLRSVPTTQLRDVQVDQTYVGGRLVFDRHPAPAAAPDHAAVASH